MTIAKYVRTTTQEISADDVRVLIYEADGASVHPFCYLAEIQAPGIDLDVRVKWLEVCPEVRAEREDGTTEVTRGARQPNPDLSPEDQAFAVSLRAFVERTEAAAMARAGYAPGT